MLAAFDFELGAGEQGPPRHLDRRPDEFEHDPPGPLGRGEGEAQVAPVALFGLAPSRLILSICLSRDCACFAFVAL